MALTWLRQLCDSSLHLLDYEPDLASLGGDVTGQRLSVRIIHDEWLMWQHDTYIAAVEAELTNTTDSPVRIAEVPCAATAPLSRTLRRYCVIRRSATP